MNFQIDQIEKQRLKVRKINFNNAKYDDMIRCVLCTTPENLFELHLLVHIHKETYFNVFLKKQFMSIRSCGDFNEH